MERIRNNGRGAAALAVILSAALLLTACGGSAGQTGADAGMEPFKAFAEQIDPGYAKQTAAKLATFGDDPVLGFRSAGSPAEHEAAEWLMSEMKAIGLENVTRDEVKVDGWTFKGANVTFTDADGSERTIDLGGYQTTIVAKDEKVPLVYAGTGTAAEYEDLDAGGKLVLIDVDQDGEWWINYPAYQAKLKGARAVLAVTIMETEMSDRIGSQDVCGPSDAPVLAISQDDSLALQEAIEASGEGEIEVVFNADSQVTPDATTYCVWGDIPGSAATDEFILLEGHYDGYYHSFYDDAAGVGMLMDMARAFVKSGIKPDKTIRLIFNGAEEWGKADSDADWAIGAYRHINEVRPEWRDQAFALVNIDSGYPLAGTKRIDLSYAYELTDFVTAEQDFLSSGDVEFTLDGGAPWTWREDFSYNQAGILTLALGDSDTEAETYFTGMYHSSKDALEIGGYSEEAARKTEEVFGKFIIELQGMLLQPFDFTARLDMLADSLGDDAKATAAYADGGFETAFDEAYEALESIDSRIAETNAAYLKVLADGDADTATAMREAANRQNPALHGFYRQLQKGFTRLDAALNFQFAHEEPQAILECMAAAVEKLEAGDGEAALYDDLSAIGLTYYTPYFDEKTIRNFNERLAAGLSGTWAEGLTNYSYYRSFDAVTLQLSALVDEGSADYEPVIRVLKDKNLGGVSDALEAAVRSEIAALRDMAARAPELP